MLDHLSFDDLQTVADKLAAGFQVLLEQVHEQKKIEGDLRLRLNRAIEKYQQLHTSCNYSSGEISDWRDEIVKQIASSVPYEANLPCAASNEKIDHAQEALQQLRASRMPAVTPARRCPVTHQVTDQEDFEHDFTTPGRIGDLGCPLTKIPNDLNGQCGPDPVAEECQGEKASARSKSSGHAGSRCPIRFLDRHSPEKIAQYFENHKHEIPRSHQICVKRYQQNEESIRQLDAKYGNLVSMIQGLGNKHKQYLPEDQKVADEPEEDSTKVVEQWAENISHQSEAGDEPDRVSHFERPLRDIRVGESPSRPWGISVPVGKSPAASASPSEDVVQPLRKSRSVAAGAVPASVPLHKHPEQSAHSERRSGSKPQIVFNGPVFFGYSAEQAALFLQNLGLVGSTE